MGIPRAETPCELCGHALETHCDPGALPNFTPPGGGGCLGCACAGFVDKGAKYCLNRDCKGIRCRRERAAQRAIDEAEAMKLNAWHNVAK